MSGHKEGGTVAKACGDNNVTVKRSKFGSKRKQAMKVAILGGKPKASAPQSIVSDLEMKGAS
jgi:hypothetical protein